MGKEIKIEGIESESELAKDVIFGFTKSDSGENTSREIPDEYMKDRNKSEASAENEYRLEINNPSIAELEEFFLNSLPTDKELGSNQDQAKKIKEIAGEYFTDMKKITEITEKTDADAKNNEIQRLGADRGGKLEKLLAERALLSRKNLASQIRLLLTRTKSMSIKDQMLELSDYLELVVNEKIS